MKTFEKFAKARAQMIMDQPFFGSLALRLRAIPTDEVKTMATDGTRLWYRPGFVEDLTIQKVRGVIAHEVMHCALRHHTRRQKRHPKKWNHAGDHVINLLLKDAGMDLPEDGLMDPQYAGMSTEAVYAMLPEVEGDGDGDASGSGRGGSGSGTNDPDAVPDAAKGDDPGGCGIVIDARAEDGTEASDTETALQDHEWQVATVQAAQAAEAAGKLPGSLRTLIDEMLEPAVDWRAVLREFLTSIARNDYTWTRANRRTIGSGLYLPGHYSEEMGDIVLAVDTSASVSNELLAQFAGEISAIMEDVRPRRVHVVYCDRRVTRVDEFEPDDLPFTLDACGRGGTRFAPVFEHVEKMAEPPEAIVYFTDMGASDWGSFGDPDVPVLWADYDGSFSQYIENLPFGQYMRVEVES